VDVAGIGPLHASFRQFVMDRYGLTGSNPDPQAVATAWNETLGSVQEIVLSPVTPQNGAKAADWRAFLDSELNFTYASVTGSDEADYQRHLARRYGTVQALNQAYQLSARAFSGSMRWSCRARRIFRRAARGCSTGSGSSRWRCRFGTRPTGSRC
jgi:hypothetical protein